MHGHPTLGVKNTKPRLSSKPGPKSGKLSEEYLEIRNAQMRTKNLTAEMQLAERRGELIEKKFVIAQSAFLMIAFRQTMMNLGTSWARRFLGLSDVREAKRLIDEMARSTLTELSGLPEKVTDPNWMNDVADDDERIRPVSGSQIRAGQARAKARRQNKTATEARRRASR